MAEEGNEDGCGSVSPTGGRAQSLLDRFVRQGRKTAEVNLGWVVENCKQNGCKSPQLAIRSYQLGFCTTCSMARAKSFERMAAMLKVGAAYATPVAELAADSGASSSSSKPV